jgi:hypothetical protein
MIANDGRKYGYPAYFNVSFPVMAQRGTEETLVGTAILHARK